MLSLLCLMQSKPLPCRPILCRLSPVGHRNKKRPPESCEDGKITSNRLVLMKVEKNGVPYVHGQTETGQEIFDYMKRITEEAGLNAQYKWDGDEVVIY